jgi:short-subunit dehydrogenase
MWSKNMKQTDQDSVVVITGGSRGLGLALAEQWMVLGAKVVLIARDKEELDNARALLRHKLGLEARVLVCDVTNQGQVEKSLSTIFKKFGKLDVLVNNAGAISAGPFESMDSEDYEDLIVVHLNAAIYSTKAALPYFKKTGKGRIINICSIGGKVPVPHMGPYCASKFALAGFSETSSIELRKYGVTVTTVYPGLMRTGSPKQAVFKGDHEKEYAWFALSDHLPFLSMSAEKAAKQIIRASQQKKSQLILSLPAKLAVLSFSLSPHLYHMAMRAAVRLLPQSMDRQRFTGEQSRAWLDSQSWSHRLVKKQKALEKRFNQKDIMIEDFKFPLQGQIPG